MSLYRTALYFFSITFILVISACGGGGGDDKDKTTETDDDNASDLISLSNFQAAEVVIGQAGFVSNADNQGGAADANTMHGPYGNASVINGVLYVGEFDNDRVLGFNSVPSVNNTPADFVLGAPNFTTVATNGVGATQFNGPEVVFFDGNKMFVVDYHNHRVLIWNTIPASGGVPADVVVGQVDFDSKAINCSATGLHFLEGGWAVDGKLIISDSSQNRVLIWNTIPVANNTPADLVLGQQDFTHCASNDTDNDDSSDTLTAQTLSYPAGVWSDGTRLVVSDKENNRILIWNTFPTGNFQSADIVLGQSDFVHGVENDDNQNDIADVAPSARTFNEPYSGLYSNGAQLFLGDYNNNRILIWNTFPTSNFQPADVVLGQGDFIHGVGNDDNQDGIEDGTPSARSLSFPGGVIQAGNQLIVNDYVNNRVLIYNGN